jgi:hypothetical protein
MGGRDVDALIQRELINAAVLEIDFAFLTTLLSGVSVGTTGQTVERVRADLAAPSRRCRRIKAASRSSSR